MSKLTQKSIIYKKIPTGFPSLGETFEIKEDELDIAALNLSPGQILIKPVVLSVDPYLRGRMRNPAIKSYVPAYKENTVMDTLGIAEVIKSNDSKLKENDLVIGSILCSTYSIIKAKYVRKVDKHPDVPLSYYLSVLGMPGMTAYIGLHEIGKPKAGETIFISGASGAVGQVVGQLAKNLGLRVVGSAGDDAKVEYLIKDLKFDAAFNYKKTNNLRATLKQLCPKGIDIYFDNVGGPTLDTALTLCNDFARVPLCGMISQLNNDGPSMYGVKSLLLAVPKRIKLEGFIVSDHEHLRAKFEKECTQLVIEGKLKISETFDHGLENLPSSFIKLFKGQNFGKMLVQLKPKL